MTDTVQPRGATFGVAFKLLLLVFAVVILIIGVQTWLHLSETQERAKTETIRDLANLYTDYNNDEVGGAERAAAALSTSLADRADIRRLFQAGDREGLLTLLTPLFSTLRQDYNIRHLYLHQPDGTVFVRVHTPTEFGDSITYRHTVQEAIATHQTVAGIEVGHNRMSVRSISPLLEDGQFIGMLEVGLDYDQAFLEQLKAKHNADLTMWILAEAAAPAGLEPAVDAPPPPSPKLFFYASTTSTRFPLAAGVYQRVLAGGQPEIEFVAADGQEWAVLVAPLLAYGGRTIGILEIAQPRTAGLLALQQSQQNILLVAGGLALFALALTWIASNYVVLRPLGHLTAVARRQLAGDTTARVELLPADEFGQLGQTLNTLNEELDEFLKNQEAVIQTRTTQLQLTLEIAKRLSSILELDHLLEAVITLTHDLFKLYHTHIYLLDDQREALKIVAGHGEAGAQMKATGHSIPLSAAQSLVARAARSGEVVRVDNVRLDENWLPNPLLPDTWSEMAVPIQLEGVVVGVLDVQSDRVAAFDEQYGATLAAVAGQIAVAMRNARRFAETAHALAEAEKVQQLYLQHGWQSYFSRQQRIVHQQVIPDAQPIAPDLLAQAKQSLTAGKATAIAAPEGQAILAAPLSIRGQIVGHVRIHETNKTRRWTPDEIALLEAVSEQMAVAIENARLFEETGRQAGREKLIAEMTRHVWASSELERVMQTAVEELGVTLNASKVVIRLGTEEQLLSEVADH
jgi:GAF domain-containing protein